MNPTPNTEPLPTLWFADERFYELRHDGEHGRMWEVVGTASGPPLHAQYVRVQRPGEPSIDALRRQHAKELQVARDMAAAQERAVVGPKLREAEQRAATAERRAADSLEREMLAAARERNEARALARAWHERGRRFSEIARRIGVIWGRAHDVDEAVEKFPGYDGEEITPYTGGELADRLCDVLARITEFDHPSVVYPAPAVAVVERAVGVLRRALGEGESIEDAVRVMLASAADRQRQPDDEEGGGTG